MIYKIIYDFFLGYVISHTPFPPFLLPLFDCFPSLLDAGGVYPKVEYPRVMELRVKEPKV
jgi:hypothetical protein